MNYKWAHLGSNQGPIPYEGTALTTELWARVGHSITHLLSGGKREFRPYFVKKHKAERSLSGDRNATAMLRISEGIAKLRIIDAP